MTSPAFVPPHHPHRRAKTRATARAIVGLVLATFALLAGCGGDDDSADGALAATEGWARSTAPDAPAAAFYLHIANGTAQADTLTDAQSDACTLTEIHTTTVDDDGVMAMAPAGEGDLTIEPGGSLTLEPGGVHVMCMGPVAPLVAGDTLQVQLGFASGTELAVDIAVQSP